MLMLMMLTMCRNNCTYCGGGIEDNYPAAGAAIEINILLVLFIIIVIAIIIVII